VSGAAGFGKLRAMSTPPPPDVRGSATWTLVGPGLVAAATGVGAGDLVATLVAGARYGYLLLWAAVLGCLMKIVLVEGVGRYTLASGQTLFEGWRSLGRWTTIYFAPYIVIWGFVYGAAAMSSTALPLVALFPSTSLKAWAIGSGLLALAMVWFGRYALIERLMAVLVGTMVIAVVGAAAVTLPNLGEIARGLLPLVPDGGLVYALGLAGGVGGTITLAAYGYWLREKGWTDAGWMRVMRIDNTVAYTMTGVFVIAMLIIGAELLYSAKIALSTGDRGLLDLADVLGQRYGRGIAGIFLVGFWASSFSSLVGVWNGVSLMFADFVAHLRGLPAGHPDAGAGGRWFRVYALWLTFPSMSLLFLDRPFALIIGYGVLGALFMPFLAVTLLWLLNSDRVPPEWRNGAVRNLAMGACAAVFALLALNELRKLFG